MMPAGDAAELQSAPIAAARLLPLARGLYELRLAAASGTQSASDLPLPGARVAAAPDSAAAVAIIDARGRPASWLGDGDDALFVKAAAEGAVVVTAFRPHDAPSQAVDMEIRRLDAPAAPVRLAIGGARQEAAPAIIDAVAHIRARGDIRFDDAPWIGRIAPELWLECFTLQPRDPAVAAAIEYKGLTASGIETPWIGGGAACGTRGQNLPLVGFAVRQKASAAELRLDCEYSGYFRSGAVVGPLRNGAPCRSARDGDALEGMRLRVTRRVAG